MNGGAVAYLAHSQYGRNRNEVTINNNSSCITGIAGDSVTASSSTSKTNAYNKTDGMLASTTGNIYGVYDMSGGAWEYTANWDTLSSASYLTSYGKAVDGEGNEIQHFTSEGTSDKYKTAYSNGTYDYYGETVKTVCRTGDGIKETWINDGNNLSWFNDCSYFVVSTLPFSLRGGNYEDGEGAGIFYSKYSYGNIHYLYSFRAVLTG